LILPTVNQHAYEVALKHFAKAVGAGPNKRIILVVDGAGWHRGTLDIPEGIHQIQLPAYSPELQPAERLWPLVREALANRDIDTLDELEELLIQRCRYLIDNVDVIRSRTKLGVW
jgi:transposase